VLESEADRLAMIRAVGESFRSSKGPLYGIWDSPSVDADGLLIPVKDRRPQIECREFDVVAHELVKESPVTREADGTRWFCREFVPDGTGMIVVLLRE